MYNNRKPDQFRKKDIFGTFWQSHTFANILGNPTILASQVLSKKTIFGNPTNPANNISAVTFDNLCEKTSSVIRRCRQVEHCLDLSLSSGVPWKIRARHLYCHLRSTVKRERFFAHVYFSNETVSQTTVSTGPMKMFRLGHETMNNCQRNVARFGHVECMFGPFSPSVVPDFICGFVHIFQ